MDNNTDKLVQDQWDSLPADVKEAISRIPWKERVNDIAKREMLDDAKAEILETETMLILYGFVSPDTYFDNLVTQLGIENEQAERIQKLVTDEIITDIEKQYEMIEALMPKDDTPKMSGPAPENPEPRIETGKGVSIGISPELLAKQITLPEVAPEILPETIPGEAAHDVPHVETAAAPIAPPAIPAVAETTPVASAADTAPTPAPIPKAPAEQEAPRSIVEEKLAGVTSAVPQAPGASSYAGKDPYREPIE